MNINCTLNCAHQKEGQCHLNFIDAEIEIQKPALPDCPYYKSKNAACPATVS